MPAWRFIVNVINISDWPQLPPLTNHEESDESEDSEPDDSIEDNKPRQAIFLNLIIGNCI